MTREHDVLDESLRLFRDHWTNGDRAVAVGLAVEYVDAHEEVRDPESAIERTYAWNERKGQFSRRQIQVAWDALASNGWLASTERSR